MQTLLCSNVSVYRRNCMFFDNGQFAFHKHCKIAIENRGMQFSVLLSLRVTPSTWTPESSHVTCCCDMRVTWYKNCGGDCRIRGVMRWGQRGLNSLGAESLWGAKKSQQCRKYFLQQHICFRKNSGSNMGRQTCFLPWTPSNLVTSLCRIAAIFKPGFSSCKFIMLKHRFSKWGPRTPRG